MDFKVGDIVIYVYENGTDPTYVPGRRYRVTELYDYKRISTECILTGTKNGWMSKYFILDKKKSSRSHLPGWF